MNPLRAIAPVAFLVLNPSYAQDANSPFREDPSVLSCAPQRLSAGQSLVLTMAPGHGKELAILREEGDVEIPFFLVVQSPPDDMRALMSREAFGAATRVEVPTSATGYKWVGEGGNERIFTTPGTYEVLLSDSLESEEGGHFCAVDYLG